jgi:hypothetical protein
MTAAIAASMDLFASADAIKYTGMKTHHTPSKKVCGDQLCSQVGKSAPVKPSNVTETTTEPTPTPPPVAKPTEPTPAPVATPSTEPAPMDMTAHQWISTTKTIISSQDPGMGHETHQLAIILPPSDKTYSGVLTYSASEAVQLVALHGPLAEGEDNGQATWTPDGTTKYALTFIDPQTSVGSWEFAGNAIAVHTKNTTPFTVSYSVRYTENAPSETVASATLTSVKDPGMGHETHQLAIILPPSDKTYSGVLTYSASEAVQLVALHGPLAEGEDNGQATWTPDGKTKYALTFIDPQTSVGSWVFAGNAIAVHTKNTTPFTVSYSVVAKQ